MISRSVKDLSLLAVVTAMVWDGVIVVGDLIVVSMQQGTASILLFCFGEIEFGCAVAIKLDDGVKKKI